MLVSNMRRNAVSTRFRRDSPHPVFNNPTFCISVCGDNIENDSADVTLSECNMLCTGNSSEYCGAGNLLNMYWSGATPPAPPEIVSSVGTWQSLGCYTYVHPLLIFEGDNIFNASVAFGKQRWKPQSSKHRNDPHWRRFQQQCRKLHRSLLRRRVPPRRGGIF